MIILGADYADYADYTDFFMDWCK